VSVAPNGGRWGHFNAFVDGAMARLKPAQVRVWVVLYRDARSGEYAGKAGMFARTAQTDIAARAGLSVRSVKLAVAGLVAAGLLRVVKRGRLNCGPSVYKIRGRAS